MSAATLASMEEILFDVIHQVTGSTPTSLRDVVKNAGLIGNPQIASKFATACIFAAAVNKPTVENFVTQPVVAECRNVINVGFTINGKINMSALSLLGHCMMTAPILDDLTFVVKFRERMGQKHIWDGTLSDKNLSKKQLEIFNSKKDTSPFNEAKDLGVGFFKVTSIDPTPMTESELKFWGMQGRKKQSSSTPPSEERVPPSSTESSPAREKPKSTKKAGKAPEVDDDEETELISYGESRSADIPSDAMEYYRAVYPEGDSYLKLMLAKYGPTKFISKMRKERAKDPEMKIRIDSSGHSTLG